ncbi:6-hydroxy-D-nicotine oxidase [Cytospora mali]|uniref:6-hydroxy-D-nicotine oxidase n=1 Tax=Cytospora mali TaxID=578113 RepID=A0A194VG75_CYTMA|nr:6-hydroxy-D-nicotine oxidase [Valsa mali var. pyri (nom. inval.)]
MLILEGLFQAMMAMTLNMKAQAKEPDLWSAFNTSANGRIHMNLPMALPCFSRYNGKPYAMDSTLCSQIRKSYTSATFRAEIVGATMSSQDDICLSYPEDQCLLDNTVTPAALPPSTSSCNQGNLASYVLPVQSASDVTAAFNFVRQYGVTLSIQNSGHDYMTRNSQKGSLVLWVHQLQNMSYHEHFTPSGCSNGEHNYGTSLTIGTGVSSDDATAFATAHNTTLLVGSSPTVAVSGGWILGAGHSVLSPVYGLGVDRVLQFTIVTPDGMLRTANACQNADLFWALRGGGGGTFGVVLDATHRVEALMPVAVADLALPTNVTAEVAVEWVALQAEMGLSWARRGWGGHGAGTYLTHVNPMPDIANLSDPSAAKESMQVAIDFVLAHGGTTFVEVLQSWNDVWEKFIKPSARSVGGIRILGGRLWPQSMFETQDGREKVINYVKNIHTLGFDPRDTYIPTDLPFLVDGSNAGYDTNTSTHPAWYTSLWNYGGGMNLAWNSSYNDRLQSILNVTYMTKMAEDLIGPGGGAYVHESNMFTQDWRSSFWGSNYQRLLEIKKKYDPDMLLDCWKCIGFEDIKEDQTRLPCQHKLQMDLDSIVDNHHI